MCFTYQVVDHDCDELLPKKELDDMCLAYSHVLFKKLVEIWC